MSDEKLSPKQTKVLDFIRRYQEEKGYPPSMREIYVAAGLAGPHSAKKVLDILERKGALRRVPQQSRSIEVLSPPRPRLVQVPLVGRVRAGLPFTATELVERYYTLDREWLGADEAFLLRVEGNSMQGAQIQEGDLALVQPMAEAQNGDIVVALIERDEATIKRFFRSRDSIRLEPANPKFKPLEFKANEKRSVTIIGKVIGVFKKIE